MLTNTFTSPASIALIVSTVPTPCPRGEVIERTPH
jgi:hypothetical protein